MNAVTLVRPVLMVALVVAAVLFGGLTTTNVFVFWAIALLAAVLLALSLLGLRNLHLPTVLWPRWPVLKAQVKFGLQGQAGNILQLLNYRFDKYIALAFVGLSGVGIYAVGVGVTESIWFISNAVAVVLVPRLTRADDDEAASLTPLFCRHTIFLSLLGAAAVGALSPLLLPLMFGQRLLARRDRRLVAPPRHRRPCRHEGSRRLHLQPGEAAHQHLHHRRHPGRHRRRRPRAHPLLRRARRRCRLLARLRRLVRAQPGRLPAALRPAPSGAPSPSTPPTSVSTSWPRAPPGRDVRWPRPSPATWRAELDRRRLSRFDSASSATSKASTRDAGCSPSSTRGHEVHAVSYYRPTAAPRRRPPPRPRRPRSRRRPLSAVETGQRPEYRPTSCASSTPSATDAAASPASSATSIRTSFTPTTSSSTASSPPPPASIPSSSAPGAPTCSSPPPRRRSRAPSPATRCVAPTSSPRPTST